MLTRRWSSKVLDLYHEEYDPERPVVCFDETSKLDFTLFGCGRGAQVVASVGCSLFLVGFLSRKPLSQMQRSTFLPLHHAATLIPSVDWGLV